MVDTEHEKKVQAELTHLRKQEAEKSLLYKRDSNAPQPSKEFIEKCIGSQKSVKMLETEARANAEKQRDTQIREARHRDWVIQQTNENQRVNEENRQQQARQQKQSITERLKQNRETLRNQGRER